MSCKIVVLYLLRITILLFSVATLACHVAQIVLLGQQDGTGSWWPDFVPYILYYVGPIVSILSVMILLILSCFQSKSLIGDRVMSVINLLLCIAIVVYNSLQSGMIPWTGAVSKPFTSNARGWVSYCPNYSTGLVSIRCWLVNGTWLGMIIIGFFWLIMALYTVVQRNSDIYNEDYDTYDYKDDVPMATTTNRKTSSIQHLASPIPPKHQPYMSPTTPHHHSFVANNNSSGIPMMADHNNNYYYQQQHPHLYDTNNEYNDDYYLNPVQEEQMNNNQHNSMAYIPPQQGDGYERSRKVSKTFLEDELSAARNNNNNSYSNESVQPPHSYDGYSNNSRQPN